MAIHRTEVAETQCLEKIAAHQNRSLDGIAHFAEETQYSVAHGLAGGKEIPKAVFGSVVSWRRSDVQQVAAHRSDVFVYRYLIVIKNNQHIGIGLCRMVQGFEGHTAADGAVTDDGYVVAFLVARQLSGHGHAQHCRDGSGRVARAESVVFTF